MSLVPKHAHESPIAGTKSFRDHPGRTRNPTKETPDHVALMTRTVPPYLAIHQRLLTGDGGVVPRRPSLTGDGGHTVDRGQFRLGGFLHNIDESWSFSRPVCRTVCRFLWRTAQCRLCDGQFEEWTFLVTFVLWGFMSVKICERLEIFDFVWRARQRCSKPSQTELK